MIDLMMPMSNKPETVRFTQAVVEHPRFVSAVRAINMVHCSHASEPTGMILIGEPGMGKSKLTRYYSDYVSQVRAYSITRDYKPVIIVETPAKRTVTNFYRAVLEALGEKNLDQGPRLTTSDMESMIIRLIEKLGVELIFFDEAHNLLPRSGEGLTSTIANTIKQLMNKTKVPMIMVGEPDTVDLRIKQKAISSRFSANCKLLPMEPHALIYNKQQKKNVDNPYYMGVYLKALEEHIEAETVSLSSKDMVLRMYLATAGIPREVRKLIVNLLDYSDLEKLLTEQQYALAFDLTNSNPMGLQFNPFKAPPKKLRQALGMER